MMMVRGVAIGAIISAPMGPVGILCVQRTLDGGRRHGFYTGIGAAISDLFYCLLTGFGLSFIEGFLQDNQQIIQILGSIVLIGYGIYIMRKNPAGKLTKPKVTAGMKGKDVLSGFLFTFSNPLILFLIIGLFARFNFQSPDYHWYHYVMGYISIVAGAVGWWWLITFIINKIRSHFNLRSMWIVNRVIGIVILIFALFGIISAFSPDAKAKISPAERIVRAENRHPSPEPVPITLPASGTDTGRLSFKRVDSEFGILSGTELVLTNMRPSPVKKYSYTDSSGKSHKVRRPAIVITVRDEEGNEKKLTLRSAEPLTYFSDEQGCETVISLINQEGKDPEIHRFSGPVTETPVNIDIKRDETIFSIMDVPDIYVRMPAEIEEITVGTEMGGEVRIDALQTWRTPVLPSDSRVAALDWTDSGKIRVNLKALGIAGQSDGPAGMWHLYSSSTDESLMRKGGDYCLLIIPSGDKEQNVIIPSGEEVQNGNYGYDILYLSGARIKPELWKTGDLKGRLRVSPYKDDWKAEWYDAEKRSCGDDISVHMSDNSLTIFFPRHNSKLLFIRTE